VDRRGNILPLKSGLLLNLILVTCRLEQLRSQSFSINLGMKGYLLDCNSRHKDK
jgi:hypothetical protein